MFDNINQFYSINILEDKFSEIIIPIIDSSDDERITVYYRMTREKFAMYIRFYVYDDHIFIDEDDNRYFIFNESARNREMIENFLEDHIKEIRGIALETSIPLISTYDSILEKTASNCRTSFYNKDVKKCSLLKSLLNRIRTPI